jgi:hypothetical protein
MPELEEVEKVLSRRKIEADTWRGPGEGTQRDLDPALASPIGGWMDHE